MNRSVYNRPIEERGGLSSPPFFLSRSVSGLTVAFGPHFISLFVFFRTP